MPSEPDRAVVEAAAEWRRHLHSIPELGFVEHKTSAFVADKLKGLGLEVHQGIGGTGVVGVLRRGGGNSAIALRADMDALKITENTGLPYASTHHGQMHACGHDGHMAMLLGTARDLTERGQFSGTVYFIFQPNEEHGCGAKAMIADGLLERFSFEEIYGLHNMPGMPVGSFATRPGPLMASEDNFVIRIRGKGGHAARPHVANDPMVIAAHMILALQTIVSRRVSALDTAVVSVTEILTDGTRNVLPETVTIKGDTRSYRPEDRRRSKPRCASSQAASP
jgi:hippurate hydrolase